jgi:hypothetical protein
MMRARGIATLALTVLVAGAAPAAGGDVPAAAPSPGVVDVREPASVTVSGIAGSSLQVRLAGATSVDGAPLPWLRLIHTSEGWIGLLPRPTLRGVYAIQLRSGPGSQTWHSRRWLLRVLQRGTLARPSFSTPEAVAHWWLSTARPGRRMVAMKRWPRPAFDRRDRRLHQLLVLAYAPAGDTRIEDRRGIFVTAFRNRYGGRWRLLEATVLP